MIGSVVSLSLLAAVGLKLTCLADTMKDKNLAMFNKLKKNPIFSECKNNFIQVLQLLLKTRTYTHGNVIYKEGDTDDNLYLIMDGEVEVSQDPNF